MEKNNKEDFGKIRFDGYYYNLRKDHINPKKTYITSIFFLRNSIKSGVSIYFENFQQFEKFLLSEKFDLILKNNKYIIGPFLIEGNKIISQSIMGGGMFEEHISTKVMLIESPEKIKAIKRYGLSEYDENQVYFFRKFDSIHKIKEKINILIK